MFLSSGAPDPLRSAPAPLWSPYADDRSTSRTASLPSTPYPGVLARLAEPPARPHLPGPARPDDPARPLPPRLLLPPPVGDLARLHLLHLLYPLHFSNPWLLAHQQQQPAPTSSSPPLSQRMLAAPVALRPAAATRSGPPREDWPPGGSLRRRHGCAFCGKLFPRSANLTRHLR
jgi:hypothetical protein